jgi:Uncharacterized protein involved in methicillin resistance
MSATVVNARSENLGACLNSHRFASLFSSPEWIEVLARTYGIEVLASIPSSQAGHGAILFSHICDLRGERVVCLPFADYCDPLVGEATSWKELIEPILRRNAPVRLRCLRNSLPAQDARFTLQRRGKWHGIDLTRPEDAMWAGLSVKARQNIRHAFQSGVVVREGRSIADVRIFHRMHTLTRKNKYRLLAQPFSFFENLHAIFAQGDRIVVLLAELNGAPLAGIFLLQWQNVLYYKFNASLDQRCRPNDLLVWRAMLFGHRRGLSMLDFGLSDIEQQGLVRYKRKFATEERDICFLESQPSTCRDARSEEASEILGCVTELLTDPAVPDRISQAAGEKFYRLFA